MTRISPWLDELLACEDDTLPDELVDRIVARGDAAREALLEVATGPEHRGIGAPNRGLAAVHAADILCAMPPDAATAAQLVASFSAYPESDANFEIVECLAAMGEVVAQPAIVALSETDYAEEAAPLAAVLATCGRRDDTIRLALLDAVRRFGGAVALAVADYGDERAIPALRAALAEHDPAAGTLEDVRDGIDLVSAIVQLDGELTDEESDRYERALARQERLLRREKRRLGEQVEAGREELTALRDPGRNDPCPCDSGRKFKQCHEGDLEFLARLRGEDDDLDLAETGP
jgi:hypothetical protein